ncbi:AIR synthase related protein [Methylobacterium sp. WSM2598]|uniref:AIR synthase related protein n=1 Tax=Methylobacterium sp. WSM2598 TaxID=398261 RepID=UPI000A017D0D|nr:AIR synthase related protein [Methylobacterium sp. WSM2598]
MAAPRSVRAAAVQIAPDLARPERAPERVLAAIGEAAGKGARFVRFPETFVPDDPDFSFVAPPVRQGPAHLRLSAAPVPVGDDCAAIPVGDGHLLLAAAGGHDGVVASDPYFAGYCGVMVNLGDVAAMGGRPLAVVPSGRGAGRAPTRCCAASPTPPAATAYPWSAATPTCAARRATSRRRCSAARPASSPASTPGRATCSPSNPPTGPRGWRASPPGASPRRPSARWTGGAARAARGRGRRSSGISGRAP